MSDHTATKAGLRAEALARRAALSAEAHRRGSRAAALHLRPLLRGHEAVALFWPMRGEIDPRELAPDIEALGGVVAMPAIEGRNMQFRRYHGEETMEAGAYGTRHPPAHHPVVHPDLVVAPLAAFDRHGGRNGYGGGYYDRALAAYAEIGRSPRFVGIAFACQEVARVPVEAHDRPLDAIATESELIEVDARL